MRRPTRSVGISILAAVVVAGGSLAWALSYVRQGYEPRQPIQFRHSRMAGPAIWETDANGERVNVGGYDIPCLYCHTMPSTGRHSTVPATAVCMNCHSTVGLDKEWVLQMKAYWDRGAPIPRVTVPDQPDLANPDHPAHLHGTDAQGPPTLECQDSHGEVETTDRGRVDNHFTMGWCVECHRKPEMAASNDCIVCHR